MIKHPRIKRLAYLVSHPIQYQAPLLRRIANEPDIYLKVFFATDLSVRSYVDPGFGRAIEWDVPLLDGYEYEFLPAWGSNQTVSFWRPINHGFAAKLKKERFDALWVHGYMRWHNWIAMLTAKQNGLKVLLRDEASARSAVRGRIKRQAKRAFFTCLRQFVDCFLAIGTLNRAYYRHHQVSDDRIYAMPYAVDNSFFQSRANQSGKACEALRRSLQLDPSRQVILYVGKLIERKRPTDLLDAYIRLSQDGHTEPDPYLVYVGDGEVRGALETRIRSTNWKSIRLAGFRSQSELSTFYHLADVFVLPSVLEPWGLVVNEVMNAGRAVIVSDGVGCAPDLVHDGENGFIFKAGNSADLAQALRVTLSNSELCSEMGRKSLAIINRWSFDEDIEGLRASLGI